MGNKFEQFLNEDTNKKQNEKMVVSTRYKAIDRKNVKVDPDVLDVINTASKLKRIKQYDLIAQAVQLYIESEFDEATRAVLENLYNK